MPIPAGTITAPAYATLAQLKAWIAVPAADQTRDTVLAMNLAAASRWVDGYCRRRFSLDATATQRSYPASVGATELLTDDIGDLAGLLVDSGTASSGTYTAVTTYAARPPNALALGLPVDRLFLDAGWAPYASAYTTMVRVTARWGWPVVPDEVGQATLIQAARLFKRKDSPEGVLGSAEWGAIRVGRVDPDVESLLAPYRLFPVA